jgi:hypothetical protein
MWVRNGLLTERIDMLATGEREEFIYQAVLSGDIVIKKDGTVWRVFQIRASGKSKRRRRVPVKPHRIDAIEKGAKGYRMVTLTRYGKCVSVGAHRLVWRHMNGVIPKGITINHKNGIKHDNRPENLELATPSEQTLHAAYVLKVNNFANRKGEACYSSKLKDNDIRDIRNRAEKGESHRSISHSYDINKETVRRIVRRERWKHID